MDYNSVQGSDSVASEKRHEKRRFYLIYTLLSMDTVLIFAIILILLFR